jgi:branched-chain amino acid transport system permease protein
MRWLIKTFRDEVIAVPGKNIALLFFAFLVFMPLLMDAPFILRIAIFANIYVIFAVSWDLLCGFTGQINLGHALFFGVSAYTSALLNYHYGLPPWVTIPIGSLVAVAMGCIVAVPAMRLRGIYLGLATLAFPIVMTGVIFAFPDLTGGELGISGLAPLAPSRVTTYYITFFVMLISVLVMWKITDVKSKIVRLGIIFQAIREDEITARASGINTIKYKLVAFCVSGFFAGVSGGLYVHVMKIAGPSTLELMNSVNAIVWTIFGGIGTIYGPVVGVYILYPLLEALWVVQEIRILIFAVIIVIILLVMPEGIGVWVKDKIEILCPRCKLINIFTRRKCRACGADLHLVRKKMK